jgi:hypothetical protein
MRFKVPLGIVLSSVSLLSPSLSYAQDNPSPESVFTLLDKRPDKERKNFYFSTLIWSCNYSVYNIGDKGEMAESFLKNRIEKLRHALVARYGDKLLQHAVSVERFRLILNGNAENTVSSINAGVAEALGIISSYPQNVTIKKPNALGIKWPLVGSIRLNFPTEIPLLSLR